MSKMSLYETGCKYATYVSSVFSFSRSEGYPTRYEDHFNPAHVDILTAGLIYSFVLLGFCLYLTLPAYKSSRRTHLFVHITLTIFIGASIVVGNFGHQWEVGHAKILTPYKPGSDAELPAEIGLHISLRGINITLKNTGSLEKLVDLRGETIDYNEHYSWEWAQGRFGFGKYAGQISRDFRESVLRGTPFPILQVAEYFTFDGEGLRFGRHYRLAGWYAHIMMWLAFPLWIITNILFCMTVHDGAVFLTLTGLCQLTSNCIWCFLRNPIELHIPFEAQHGHGHGHDAPKPEVILMTHFGPDYYLVLFNGLLCVFLGVLLLILDDRIPDTLCKFLNLDPLSAFDEHILTGNEELKGKDDNQGTNLNQKAGGGLRVEGGKVKINFGSTESTTAGNLNAITENEEEEESSPRTSTESTTVLRRRDTAGAKIQRTIQKSFRKPSVKPRKADNKVLSTLGGVEEENELDQMEPTTSTPLLKKKVDQTIVSIHEEAEPDSDDDGPTYDNLPPAKSKN